MLDKRGKRWLDAADECELSSGRTPWSAGILADEPGFPGVQVTVPEGVRQG